MGLFLSMSGIVGASSDSVAEALQVYAADNDGSLKQQELTTEDDGCLVLSEGVGGVTVLYPDDFFDWDACSEHLSKHLGCPVFSFHIHDSDLWMYVLFEDGEVVDQFNPMPAYWQELDDEERSAWQGDASAVARRVPGLSPEQIVNYLVEWGDEIFESDEQKKAYPSDKFHVGEDWQLVDFMTRLGFDFPVDDRGAPHGVTYFFQCNSEDSTDE